MGLTGFNRARRAQEEAGRKATGVSAPAASSDKAILIAKALELELGTEDELAAMSDEELTQAIADASDDGNTADKDALIAKALELQIASKSALARMSVKKLTALIAEKAQA